MEKFFLILFFCIFIEGLGQQISKRVHIVPHSHWDLGWLFTIEEYFKGVSYEKTNLEIASVERIISSVLEELGKNPERKFILSEIGFIKPW